MTSSTTAARTPRAGATPYSVKVIEGREVVDAIEKVATGSKAGHQDVPKEDVIIEKAEIIE
jgi:Peptidyl-prolyl cis-trans isomerase (rotamase) - cyclophilin family